jgi:preprotein translocase subunit SecY
MLSAFANSFKIPELRTRILFTLGMIFLCRLVSSVPAPGVDPVELQNLIARLESQAGGAFLGWLDLFSGGGLQKCAVGGLGIMPYISASIILQMMTAVIPALERLAREGDPGRQKLTQYTRYLTLVICVIQGLFLAKSLEHPGFLGISGQIVLNPGIPFELMTILTMTTGTMLLMWFGEQMTERGIGNGVSMVITISIVSRILPAFWTAKQMFTKVEGVSQFTIFHLIGLLLMLLAVTAGTIMLTQGQRKIPIHTTKRVIGRKVYGGQNTYMPLRVNYSGVMPIIFGSALLQFTGVILRLIPIEFCHTIGNALNMNTFFYMIVYGILLLFFSYFWVATQFNPIQIADDLKKNGGYVPGIRPGRPTAEFLDKTMTRITLMGALFLTVIAVIPSVLFNQFGIPWNVAGFLGGTSQLIVVGVALDTLRQVESHLLERHYDGFLRKGRLRGRR